MTEPSTVSAPCLQPALQYASRGLAVFPVHSAVGVVCSCGHAGCKDPGKHPRIREWTKQASTDPMQVRRWWRDWPAANVGIRTGNGLVVVDIDSAKGGDEAFQELINAHEPLPITPESVTGGGGRHIFFSIIGSIKNSVRQVAPGVDIRGDGGFVVAAPSVHASGRFYEWASGRSFEDVELAPIPIWIATLAMKRRVAAASGPAEIISEGGRNDALNAEGYYLRTRRGYSDEEILNALLTMNETRCRPPLDETEVKRIVTSVCKQPPTKGGGMLRPAPIPGRIHAEGTVDAPPHAEDWKQELSYDRHGNINREDPGNVALIIGNSPEWAGCLTYNEFANSITWTRKPPDVAGMRSPELGELRDTDRIYVQKWLTKRQGALFALGHVEQGIIAAAGLRTINPLKEYLNGLQWDHVPRVTRWLSTYFGAIQDAYSSSIGMWWLISAVARALTPGCQADHTLVLEGPQGKGKTTGARILAGPWFLGNLPDLRDEARAADQLRGKWIVELGELDAIRGTAATKVKNFLSQTQDTYRAAYAHFKGTYPRSCVFIGTTNEHKYLHDPSGARRFWPVRVHALKREDLIRDRDQIWAEAVHMFLDGTQWWPTPEIQEALDREQEDRFDTDPWEEVIAERLADPSSVDMELTTKNVLERWLKVGTSDYSRAHSNRIAAVMRRLGFISEKVRKDRYTTVRVWKDCGTDVGQESVQESTT